LGTAITFLTNDDDEVMCVKSSLACHSQLTRYCFPYARYDLKQGKFLKGLLNELKLIIAYPEISKSPVSKVPIELAKHEAAQHKVSREMKRKRDAEDQG
jgi:ATP-dependent RNA helicase DDX23/PRP28